MRQPILFRSERMQVPVEDLRHLQDMEFLNDTIIEFYLNEASCRLLAEVVRGQLCGC